LIRNGAVEDLFVPHTVMAEHEALAPKGAKKLGEQYRHMITRAMGIAETVEPDIFEIQYFDQDILVLCSDGLSDKVSSSEVLALAGIASPETACKSLVNLANERGGDDNITIIVLKIWERDPEKLQPSKVSDGKQITIEYDTEDASYRAYTKKITEQGIFIETMEPFSLGQELMLTLSDSSDQNSLIISGKVSDRKPDGVEIKFDNPNTKQKKMIQNFIKKE